jgi:hypothetical protein
MTASHTTGGAPGSGEIELEERSRLVSVRDVCAYELQALQAFEDPRLDRVTQLMQDLHAQVETTLGVLACLGEEE